MHKTLQDDSRATSRQKPETEERTMSESESPCLDTDSHASAQELNKLGWSHFKHFQGTGALGALNQAVVYLSRAVAMTPDEHPDMADRLADLGVSYTDRFQRLGNLEDLDKAVECDSRALALTPDGHPDLADRLANLGVSYSDRYRRIGDVDDLEKSIDCFSRALELTPDGHPHMSDRLADLGSLTEIDTGVWATLKTSRSRRNTFLEQLH
ncbi:hypothetical protein ACGC1H_006305 [Rhizoctonia solani]